MSRNGDTPSLTSHGKAKDGKGEESGDEKEHDGEVEPEGPWNVEAGANKTSKGDDEDDKAEDEEGQLEERLTGGAAPRHPQPSSDQRNWHEQCEQVQEPN